MKKLSARNVKKLLESIIVETSPAAIASRGVLPEFSDETVVVQVPAGGSRRYYDAYGMSFLPVNKRVFMEPYVNSLTLYLTKNGINYAEVSMSKNGFSVFSQDKPIFSDKRIMSVIDRWITSKTNWMVVDMTGKNAENVQVLADNRGNF